eukprot:1985088-Pleurochrysis_carterae.AAC.1
MRQRQTDRHLQPHHAPSRLRAESKAGGPWASSSGCAEAKEGHLNLRGTTIALSVSKTGRRREMGSRD